MAGVCGPAVGAAFPVVIISHGYPGNRYLLSHLGENLASKGFVTVAIDHTDSTYDRQLAFASTLYNRPLDQLFVLNELDRLGRPGSGSFLEGLVDASRTGIIGYSMGGYGVYRLASLYPDRFAAAGVWAGYTGEFLGAYLTSPRTLAGGGR